MVAKAAVALEAIIGVMYLTIIMARLVSLYSADFNRERLGWDKDTEGATRAQSLDQKFPTPLPLSSLQDNNEAAEYPEGG